MISFRITIPGTGKSIAGMSTLAIGVARRKAAVDERTDAMMDALVVEPNLIDADVGADLKRGWTEVCTVVEGEDEGKHSRGRPDDGLQGWEGSCERGLSRSA